MNVQQFYEKNFYPHGFCYPITTPPKVYSPCVGMNNDGKDILVIGSGSIEAVVVANSNPLSGVTALDISKSQLAISKSIARKHRIKNIHHLQCDISKDNTVYPTLGQFDIVTAVGVLHHIPDVKAALLNIRNMLKDDGVFTGMVYAKQGRPDIIRQRNKYFLDSKYTVKDVHKWFKTSERNAEALMWYHSFQQTDAEVADTWLHPYFTEYTYDSLVETLNPLFMLTEYEANKTKILFKAEKRTKWQKTEHISPLCSLSKWDGPKSRLQA